MVYSSTTSQMIPIVYPTYFALRLMRDMEFGVMGGVIRDDVMMLYGWTNLVNNT